VECLRGPKRNRIELAGGGGKKGTPLGPQPRSGAANKKARELWATNEPRSWRKTTDVNRQIGPLADGEVLQKRVDRPKSGKNSCI